MVNWNDKAIPQDIDNEDHPEGGANALNINRLVEIALLNICIFFRFFNLWKPFMLFKFHIHKKLSYFRYKNTVTELCGPGLMNHSVFNFMFPA